MQTITHADPDDDIQQPAAVAVVVPTVLRPSLLRMARSVFAQELAGKVQIMIGIDKAQGDRKVLDEILAERPDHVRVTILDPGYSTSQRHGGVHRAYDGGALRTVLSYLANSRYVTYLDDDNWIAPNHLATLVAAAAGKAWSFSYRHYVHPETQETIAVDKWESVGPGKGVFNKHLGGFCDPNTILVDVQKAEPVLRLWNVPYEVDDRNLAADRTVFHYLARDFAYGKTGEATSYYVIDPSDDMHPHRLKFLALDGIELDLPFTGGGKEC